MADITNPLGGDQSSAKFLPSWYRTDANKKFLHATIDQLTQPGTVQKINGYIGRQYAKATINTDIFVTAAAKIRQDYQVEPSVVVRDPTNSISFFKDYQDYINQLGVFGANITNHCRINQEEFYVWNPHISWDMLINYRDYYWMPSGPSVITVYGKSQLVECTYSVSKESEGDNNTYIFSVDSEFGLIRNPVVELFRGQTYKFEFVIGSEYFNIKTARTLGEDDRYTLGVSTAIKGDKYVITFTVPLNAQDTLYYQNESNIDMGGVFDVQDIKDNSSINVTTDILGMVRYTTSDGVALSNGMKLRFGGHVFPASYATGEYYVEGVGTAIQLISVSSLHLMPSYGGVVQSLFDATPFDELPFGDNVVYAAKKDYIVINRASCDKNQWSRYNRWVHKDVIVTSATHNKEVVSLDHLQRAKRPIIEFEANLKLYDFGTCAIPDIHLWDTTTDDAFSTIEGQLVLQGKSSFKIDGRLLSAGDRVIFTADTDPLVKNVIYTVEFVTVLGNTRVHLVPTYTPVAYDTTLVLYGTDHTGQMIWFNGSTWEIGQEKIQLNQPPKFDVVDSRGMSYSNQTSYKGSDFSGTRLFSYKIGAGRDDTELGFPLFYKNVENGGDIVFNFDLELDTFVYKELAILKTRAVNLGFLQKSSTTGAISYVNGWKTSDLAHTQGAVRIFKNTKLTNNFPIDIFDELPDIEKINVRVYVNSVTGSRKISPKQFTIIKPLDSVHLVVSLAEEVMASDVVTLKVYNALRNNSTEELPINGNGHYEIPINLQNNPLNQSLSSFTLGEVMDHLESILDNAVVYQKTSVAYGMRDYGDITAYGTKFIQHSGPASLSLYHITSPENNVVRAIEKARDDYNRFKRNFIVIAETLGVDADTANFVDRVLQQINRDKPVTSPYYFSDMVPYGSNTRTEFIVEDGRVRTYSLETVFSMSVLSNRGVGVYLNNVQLCHGDDYTFNQYGFVEIASSVVLTKGDSIVLYEYDNTDGCYVPETPTKLGMWPKFKPYKYLDTSLVTPREMIQCHDGSLVLSYGDYRDDLILELERRIYNNIKIEYDPALFNIHSVVPSYNRDTQYNLDEFNTILAPYFYTWTMMVDQDYTKPLSFDRTNSMTYNYRNHAAPNGKLTPGYWRGIYQWMYDTDRPHLCPWEMLGFSEQPKWWTQVYGSAPYTKDNLVMWGDIATGTVRAPGVAPVVRKEYAKAFMVNPDGVLSYIPVDDSGALISPIQSGVAIGAITPHLESDYQFGDIGPVEAAWRRSSYYPFSVLLASMLMMPAKVFGVLLDRSRIQRNIAGQLVYKDTGLCIRPSDILLPTVSTSVTHLYTAGVINYIVNYVFTVNDDLLNAYKYNLQYMACQLSYRVGAFTSKEKFNLMLDSKTVDSTSVFIPKEDYDVVFNTSSPVKKLVYSGIIVNKVSDGYIIKGYSRSQPYFKYYTWSKPGIAINIGGISESYSEWSPVRLYTLGKNVQYGNQFYRVKESHTSTQVFDITKFTKLVELPMVGGRDAYIRKEWNKYSVYVASYGTKFQTIQEVVDFILGYGAWLEDQGFKFDEYNSNIDAIMNWETSVKEFLFWTTQNWSTGEDKWDEWQDGVVVPYGKIVRYNGDYYQAMVDVPATVGPPDVAISDYYDRLDGLSTVGSSVLSLSPSAHKVTFETQLCAVDDIKNEFNGYEIVAVDGNVILPHFLNSYRGTNEVSYSPRGNAGIYGATFYFVQKEHVVIIKNNTIFNDTIYNPPTGYKQDRIRLSAYVSTNWNGMFDAPGFIYDRAKIDEWMMYKDYALGDIVKHKEQYYTAKSFVSGNIEFNPIYWYKLDKVPESRLLPNWSYKATQFTDFYSLDSDNFDITQQKMAQHLIGYQKRQYLANIIKDDVSEFKFYQGMIAEKGTKNVFDKLFNVLSRSQNDSVEFYEEWALRVGQYGASNAFESVEIVLDEALCHSNPQGFELVKTPVPDKKDFIIRPSTDDLYVTPMGYTATPWPVITLSKPFLRNAGHVRSEEVRLVVKNIDEILSYNVQEFREGDYIWCTFEGPTWNVYKYIHVNVNVQDIVSNGKGYDIVVDSVLGISVGSIIGLVNIQSGNRFYKVVSIIRNIVTVIGTSIDIQLPFNEHATVLIYTVVSQRAASIDDLNSIITEYNKPGALVWTGDANSNESWATWEYNKVYSLTGGLIDYSDSILAYGRSLAITHDGTVAAFSSTSGEVKVYEYGYNLRLDTYIWNYHQLLGKPYIGEYANTAEQFSTILAFSPTGTWLVTGSPTVSHAKTVDVVVNGVTLRTITSPVGVEQNYMSHGAVSIYRKDKNNVAMFQYTIVSPNIAANECFGSNVVVGDDSLLITASGYNGGIGRVYSYQYDTVVRASTAYNPSISSGINLGVTSTIGITRGMTVAGVGFTGQYVVEVVSSTMLYLNNPPTSTPSGNLQFTLNEWKFDGVISNPVLDANTNFGKALGISRDGNTVVIASPGSVGVNGRVDIYTRDNTHYRALHTVPGGIQAFGTSVAVSDNGEYIAFSSPLYDNVVQDQGIVYVCKNMGNTSVLPISKAVTGQYYVIETVGTTDFTANGAATNLIGETFRFFSSRASASAIKVGKSYTIAQLGTTDFVSLGASNNVEGVTFIATHNGDAQSGSGLVTSQGSGIVITTRYELQQEIFQTVPEYREEFGSKIAFTNNYKTLAIYSQNGNNSTLWNNIDQGILSTDTVFDDGYTTFTLNTYVDSGRVDIYDRYENNWIFSESLDAPNITEDQQHDGYGLCVAIGANNILVSAPFAVSFGEAKGQIYTYRRESDRYTWTIKHGELPRPDVYKIKRAFLYNKTSNRLLTYLDVIDVTQGKIPGVADQELRYKTYYDPAIYSVGTSAVNVDEGMPWTAEYTGILWWDLRTVKFMESNDSDVVYRNSLWNEMAHGSSVDIYEWVCTPYLPSAWDELADTVEGLTLGISGTSLYGDAVYSISRKYDTVSKTFKLIYYYWVKNKTVAPDAANRSMSANAVANMIANPRGQGYKYMSLTGVNSFNVVNVNSLLVDKNVVLAVDYWVIDSPYHNIHTEWKLVSNERDAIIPPKIEQKWVDSLCLKDQMHREVPDSLLPLKLRYGIENRPRQTMFVNPFEALKQIIEQANSVMIQTPIAVERDLSGLQTYDPKPTLSSGLYDIEIETNSEFRFVSMSGYITPVVAPVVVNGRITGITIIAPGAGYAVAPYITVVGSGINAKVRAVINTEGAITGCVVENPGEGYDHLTQCTVRSFSVLLTYDDTVDNKWAIYAYDTQLKVWSRVLLQTYDTRKYWKYADWYGTYTDTITGIVERYNQFSAADYSVSLYSDLPTVSPQLGELVKVLMTGTGGWVLLRKYAEVDTYDWTQIYQVVGMEKGTIQFLPTLYDFIDTTFGYDSTLYDDGVFDNMASIELQNIIFALRNGIFVGDLRKEYINLFFVGLRYAFSEQNYLDWAFKTSFIKAAHNVGTLLQKVTYSNDNLPNFEEYMLEVKPYRTKIREYVSQYDTIEDAGLSVTDFDLPPIYGGDSSVISTEVINGAIAADNPLITEYPWKYWYDNVGFEVTDIIIRSSGSGYYTTPVVRIESDSGYGATATASISDGKVTKITIVTRGEKYLSAPTIVIDGGHTPEGTTATAIAYLGNSITRSMTIEMKFDRTTSAYYMAQLQHTEYFVGTGYTTQFRLQWLPDIGIGRTIVLLDNIEVSRIDYEVIIFQLSKGVYIGAIVMNVVVPKNGKLTVKYHKNVSLLNAADRIQHYYDSKSNDGRLGKDLSQLMSGVDYGGVIIDGVSFEGAQTQEIWDSFTTVDDVATSVVPGMDVTTLSYIPAAGTEMNVYLVKKAQSVYVSDGTTIQYVFNSGIVTPVVTVSHPVTTAMSTMTGTMNIEVDNADSVRVGDVLSLVPTTGSILATDSATNRLSVTSVDSLLIDTCLEICGSSFGGIVPGRYYVYEIFSLENEITIRASNSDTPFIVSSAIGTMVYRIMNAIIDGTTVVDIVGNTIGLSSMVYNMIPQGAQLIVSNVPLMLHTDFYTYGAGGLGLTRPIIVGYTITISGELPPVRIDRGNIVMDGENNSIDLSTMNSDFSIGDTIIIRESTNDGAALLSSREYDMALSGGTLQTYESASGLLADDIIIDGDGLVSPTTCPAPEEVVPGHVVDSVAIKVYDYAWNGSARMVIDRFIGDGVTVNYTLSHRPNSTQAIIVKLNSTVLSNGVNYTIDYRNIEVILGIPPSTGSEITIFSIGCSGMAVISNSMYVSNGIVEVYDTLTPWIAVLSLSVYVDGNMVDVVPIRTANDTIGIQFVETPAMGAIVAYIITHSEEQKVSYTKVERFTADGRSSSQPYPLLNVVGDGGPVESKMLVRVGQSFLQGPEVEYFTIKSNKFTYALNPARVAPYSVNVLDVVVYVGDVVLTSAVDYIVELSGVNIKLVKNVAALYSGKELSVAITTNSGYFYNNSASGPTIRFPTTYNGTVVEVMSSYNHMAFNMHRTEVKMATVMARSADTPIYYTYQNLLSGVIKLDRLVADEQYIWVIKNGTLLIPSEEFILNGDRSSIQLLGPILQTDKLSIITFGNNLLSINLAYMQFKDMLNRTHFKRLNSLKQTRLTRALRINDLTIEVDDATYFDVPNPDLNIPGVLEISGERIEFFIMNGNVLGQLRRGTLGTGARSIYPAGSSVQEIGPSESLPYADDTTIIQIPYTGSKLLEVDFIPTKSSNTWSYRGDIPAEYGQCNDIEVFVGGYDIAGPWKSGTMYEIDDIVQVGIYLYRNAIRHRSEKSFFDPVTTYNTDGTIRDTSVPYTTVWKYFIGNIRLKKCPYTVHNINISDTTVGDVPFSADFAVDGVSNHIRLTNSLKLGTYVTIIRRSGVAWGTIGDIREDNGRVAEFLRSVPGALYSTL